MGKIVFLIILLYFENGKYYFIFNFQNTFENYFVKI